MKPFIRITMSMVCLTLLLWGGVAVPAEASPAPESCEYMMAVVEAYPGWGVEGVVASDQLDAAIWLAYRGSEEEREQGFPGEPVVAGVISPEPGSYEYSIAMETGNLPSACAGKACPTETFTIIEIGTLRYRQGIDDGGGGE